MNGPQGFMTASAPGSHCGSRRGSNAGIFIEPEQNPESYGRIFFVKKHTLVEHSLATLLIEKIITLKNARACVSMDFT